MAKDAAQEQDLFSAPVQIAKEVVPDVESVTQLTKKIRDLLELRFADVTVEGEISNFLHHRSEKRGQFAGRQHPRQPGKTRQ